MSFLAKRSVLVSYKPVSYVRDSIGTAQKQIFQVSAIQGWLRKFVTIRKFNLSINEYIYIDLLFFSCF